MGDSLWEQQRIEHNCVLPVHHDQGFNLQEVYLIIHLVVSLNSALPVE